MNPFKRNNARIMADLGIKDRRTLDNARHKLAQAGLINFEKSATNPNVTYTITSAFNAQANVQADVQVPVQVSVQVPVQVGDTKYKLNKTKQNKIPPSIPQGGSGGDFFNLVLKKKDGGDNTPDPDGVKRNLPGLIEKLHKLKVPEEQFNKICEFSNLGEIGHPVWEIVNRASLAGEKIRSPGLYILSQLRVN